MSAAKTSPGKITPAQATDFGINFLASGQNLGVLKGLTRKDLDDLYWIGHSHYTAGNYADAEKVFHGLCFYDHKELRNWLAWGGALQMQGKVEKALTAYSFGQLMDLDSPEPAFRAFECHLALQNYREAQAALETVIVNSGDKEHEALRHRAEALLKELSAALEKAGA